jgi:hypothetical protein
MQELVYKNYMFLKNQNFGAKDVPVQVISKSLILLSYCLFLSNEELLSKIFVFLKEKENKPTEIIACENIFLIYKKFVLDSPVSTIKFRAFESFGFFWVRFPNKLVESKEIIAYALKTLKSDDEKKIILRTFQNFFQKISLKIKETHKSNNNGPKADLGFTHLFFEAFIADISNFITEENNQLIRLQSISLIKLIVELGNINHFSILPSIFAALFDHFNEVRFMAVSLLEIIILNNKDKFLSCIKECLKSSYKFQKRIYGDHSLINSMVKTKHENNINYIVTNENIFELFSHRIGKAIKDETIFKKMLTKFITTFQDIKNFLSQVNSLSLEKCLEQFEFYEFVIHMIGDFKYSKTYELVLIYKYLFQEYETERIVFFTKFKEIKKDSNLIDNKLILSICSLNIKITFFKFFSAKYDNFDEYENKIDHLIVSEDIKNLNHKHSTPNIHKDLKNFKFHEFYVAPNILNKKLFETYLGNSKSKLDFTKIISLVKCLKDFSSLKISEVRKAVGIYKRKQINNRHPETLYNSLMYTKLKEGDEESKSKIKIRKNFANTDNKVNKTLKRKRTSLDNTKEASRRSTVSKKKTK